MNRHTLFALSVATLVLGPTESRGEPVDDTTPPDYLKGPPLPPPDEATMLSMFPIFREIEPSLYDYRRFETKRQAHEPDMAKRTSFPDTLRGAKGHRKGAKAAGQKR